MLGKVNKRRLRRPNVSIVCHAINELKPERKSKNPPKQREMQHPIHQSIPPTGQKRLLFRIPDFYKQSRRIKRDDIDPTHLLCDHNDKTSECGASDAGDGEEFDEAGDISGSSEDFKFFGELAMDVVEVAAGLEVRVAEAAEGGEGFVVAAFLEEPSGRFYWGGW